MKKPLQSRRTGSRSHRSFRPLVDPMERRRLLSFADGNGPVVTGLTEPAGPGSGATLVVTFDGPLNAATAEDPANYAVNRLAAGNPEFVTRAGAPIAVRSATYNAGTDQVTLTLARPLASRAFYRVWINGSPGTGLTDINGVLFDGDNDDTPGGDFYGLFAHGASLKFTDSGGDKVSLRLTGGGQIDAWRELDGDLDGLTLVGTTAGQSTLTGSVVAAKGSTGQVVTPPIQGLAGVNNGLSPQVFVAQATVPTSPTPVVATAQNLPYTLQITPVAMPSVPGIQSAVYAQSGGLWLVFGGRTNGLHGFDPSGLVNFPPQNQNNNIYVINPATGQTWSMPWSATGLPASEYTSLSSANQDYYQSGDHLDTAGGYSYDSTSGVFTTYDTLTSLSVKGLIDAVVSGGGIAQAKVRQIASPRFEVTGGEMDAIDGRTYLVFGQNFQGGYNGNNADFYQIYSDEIRSFRIVPRGKTLAVAGYKVQRDPVNFRRRDYNLGNIIEPNGKAGLMAFGGVFTPAGNGYRYPILIGPDGQARVDDHYQQYFTQYTAAHIPLFDARDRSMDTIFLGGISLYDYDFATGQLTTDPELPFVDDVTTYQLRADGSSQEYMMPSQLPGLYGTEAAFFAAPGLPTYSNGVIKLAKLTGPTTLGYMYGGIYSTVPNTTDEDTQTTSSNQVFRVTLVPTAGS